MADVFDVMLMERRPDKYVPRAAWQEYLRTSFADNKPWDVLVREMLSRRRHRPEDAAGGQVLPRPRRRPEHRSRATSAGSSSA